MYDNAGKRRLKVSFFFTPLEIWIVLIIVIGYKAKPICSKESRGYTIILEFLTGVGEIKISEGSDARIFRFTDRGFGGKIKQVAELGDKLQDSVMGMEIISKYGNKSIIIKVVNAFNVSFDNF